VKTRQSRTVPLHEHLIEQGFLEFVQINGKGPLFYNTPAKEEQVTPKDPTNPATPRSASVRETIGKWVREVGITDREIQPNHAWRHTFKLIGARHGMRDAILDTICGHAPASEGRGYGKPELIDLAEELKKFPRYDLS
jgi:integrase